MSILAIRTDKPEAELYLMRGNEQLACLSWTAHRQLAETIHAKIKQTLTEQGSVLKNIEGIVVFQGPGSFTGLRIGLSVANALAYGLDIPIVGKSGNDWLQAGVVALQQGANSQTVTPEYGSPPHITQPKK